MSESIVYRTKDHPEANGRQPCDGEHQWAFTFPLESGETLTVLTGDEGLRNLRTVVIDQMIDEQNDPNYNERDDATNKTTD